MAFASFCLEFVTFILDTPIRIKSMIVEKHEIMKRWEEEVSLIKKDMVVRGYRNSATKKSCRGDASEN